MKQFWIFKFWRSKFFWLLLCLFSIGSWITTAVIYYFWKYPFYSLQHTFLYVPVVLIGYGAGMMITILFFLIVRSNKFTNTKRRIANSKWLSDKKWSLLTTTYCFPEDLHTGGWVVDIQRQQQKINFTTVPYGNALVVGSTGYGKTQKIVLPNILLNMASSTKPSMVITDPKGALWKLIRPYLKVFNYQYYHLDFVNFAGHHWNPLISIYRLWLQAQYDQAEKKLIIYVDTVFPTPAGNSDPFWHRSAQKLIRGVIMGLMIEKATFAQKGSHAVILPREIHEKIAQPRACLVEWLSILVQNNTRMKLCLGALIYENEKTLSSIINQADSEIARFSFGLFNEMCTRNDLDFNRIASQPIIVIIQTSTTENAFYFLAQLFIENLLSWLLTPRFLKHDHPILFMLEEFGVIPEIKSFNQVLANCREYNFWFLIIIQYYRQLKRYTDTAGIDANTNLKYFLGNDDHETNRWFATKYGHQLTSYGDSSKQKTLLRKEPLIDEYDLSRLKSDEVIIKIARQHPYLVHVSSFWQWSELF